MEDRAPQEEVSIVKQIDVISAKLEGILNLTQGFKGLSDIIIDLQTVKEHAKTLVTKKELDMVLDKVQLLETGFKENVKDI